MARAGREEWAKRVQRWQESGLTAGEFARETGLKASTLSFWKWRLKREQEAPPATRGKKPRNPVKSAVRFVEISAPVGIGSDVGMMELVVEGRYVVRIGCEFDGAVLSRLLDALEQRA